VSDDIIKFENVNFVYPKCKKNALIDINLSIKKGEFLAVMGSNGSGKTTFCKLINGIIPHLCGGSLKGTVTVDGKRTDESSVPQLALKVGMVLDDPEAQIFTSTVRDEAAFGPENFLLPLQEINERVKSALCAVGLSGFESRAPATLSGGEKQRLSIAAALAMKGDILVLDEPLCRLDPQGAQEVMSVLKDIRTQYQITIIMTSHDSEKMAEFADRVCILNNGKIAALDTAEKIFANSALLEENGVRGLTRKDAEEDKRALIFSAKIRGVPEVRNSRTDFAISVNNFCYSYSNGIRIENINVDIMENDFAAIIGGNGCGKTTLLKNITGLLRPCEGEIYIRGRNTKELSVSDISKEAGFVMQNPDAQLFCDSVFNEIAFALKNMRLPKAEIKKRVQDAMETVGLDDAGVFPHILNRADRTKTIIACVIAMGCKILIFDEIDVGNDYLGNLKIMNIAKDLHSKGFTIIFITHNMALVDKYAHRLIKMERNGIVSDWRRK